MKGIELPISLIVIIAIAVLVLVILAGFFSGYFFRQSSGVGLEAAFQDACGRLISVYRCSSAATDLAAIKVNYQATGAAAATPTPLFQAGATSICSEKGITDLASCRRQCGCPA